MPGMDWQDRFLTRELGDYPFALALVQDAARATARARIRAQLAQELPDADHDYDDTSLGDWQRPEAAELADLPACFDLRLDRIDVAVRALLYAAQHDWWQLLADVGLTLDDHWPQLDDALLTLGRPKNDAHLMHLLHRCPFLLDAAIELLRLYGDRAFPGTRRAALRNTPGPHAGMGSAGDGHDLLCVAAA